MGRNLSAAIALFCLVALVLPAPALSQANDNDYTPLNSRIRHDRQFPLEPPPNFVPEEKMGKVERDWTHSMMNQLSKCIYNRSKEGALGLLDKTDIGFVDFKQIGMDGQKAMRIYGFDDCLGRVATSNGTGVAIRFYASNLRQWMIQAAYMDQYPKGPTWLKPGYVIEQRDYPLSKDTPGVRSQMDFIDCVVAADPYNADFFYRTAEGSANEQEAVSALTPSLGPCLPQGVRIQLNPAVLRAWLGEGLWHAAAHSVPAPTDTPPSGH
ncbi:MAG: hypothetical protein ACXWI5_08420 [Croceibacterium sp.]